MSNFRAYPAVRHTLRTCYKNLGSAFHLGWPWMLIIGIPGGAIQLYAGNAGTDFLQSPATALTLLLFNIVVSTVGICSFSVNWHRRILRDEKAEGWLRLRLDRPVWRYIGNGILIALLGLGVPLAIIFSSYVFLGSFFTSLSLELGPTWSWLLLTAVLVVLGAWWSMLVQRLAIKLPAIALERQHYGFGAAWRDTSGSFFSIMGFYFLFLLAVLIIAVVGGLVLAIPVLALSFAGMHLVSSLAAFAGQMVANWVGTFASIVALTTLYGAFAEGRDV